MPWGFESLAADAGAGIGECANGSVPARHSRRLWLLLPNTPRLTVACLNRARACAREMSTALTKENTALLLVFLRFSVAAD